jgi:integrase
MSVEKIQRANGPVWRVRWRDEQGRARSRVVGRKADALALDNDLKRAKRLGGTAIVANHRETLAEFSKLWWARHAAPNLARHTLESYASALDVHLIPRLGETRLTTLTTEMLSDMRADMAVAGVGEQAIRKVLTVLQSILERAVEWRHIESNPVRAVRKPSQHRTRVVRPLPPKTIEVMRTYLLATDRRLDSTLVAVLAYAGLRPGEAIGLRWHDVGDRTLLVERSVAFGQLKSTKTGGRRSVRLLPSLKEDLTAWREQTDRGAAIDLVFPSPDGSPWNADRARNWRKRAFADAAAEAGVPTARPYDLRHSFISLLIAQGATVVEVARQAGHAPTMTLSTYAHLFDELDGADHRSAEEQVRAARLEKLCPEVSVLCPRPAGTYTPVTEKAPIYGAFSEPSVGLEPTTPSLPWKVEGVTNVHERSRASTKSLQTARN